MFTHTTKCLLDFVCCLPSNRSPSDGSFHLNNPLPPLSLSSPSSMLCRELKMPQTRSTRHPKWLFTSSVQPKFTTSSGRLENGGNKIFDHFWNFVPKKFDCGDFEFCDLIIVTMTAELLLCWPAFTSTTTTSEVFSSTSMKTTPNFFRSWIPVF